MGTGGGSWGRRYLEDEKDSAKFTSTQSGMQTKALKPSERHPTHPMEVMQETNVERQEDEMLRTYNHPQSN